MTIMPQKNMAAKILALIMAVIIWMYVMNEQNPPLEVSFSIPLEIQNLTTPYMVAEAPETVRVKVRGLRKVVAFVSSADIKAYLDLRGVSEGRQTVKVHVVIPPNLELAEVNPDQTMVRIDTTAARQIPVEIHYSGAVVAGAMVGQALAAPVQVAVQGPKSLVDTVDRVVATVDLNTKNADFTTEAALKALSRDGKLVEGVSFNPSKVAIAVTMSKVSNKKTVEIKPQTYGDLGSGFVLKRIAAEPETVEVQGPSQELEKIDAIYTVPINLSGLTKDSNPEVKLQLKEGITASQTAVVVHIYLAVGSAASGTNR